YGTSRAFVSRTMHAVLLASASALVRAVKTAEASGNVEVALKMSTCSLRRVSAGVRLSALAFEDLSPPLGVDAMEVILPEQWPLPQHAFGGARFTDHTAQLES